MQISYAGNTITVPVVDRGPWSGPARYDLTYAAAQVLGMSATERVTVAWLAPGAPLTAPTPGAQPAPAPAAPPASASGGFGA